MGATPIARDAVKVLIDYLDPLADFPVLPRVPHTRLPGFDPFAVIRRIGGTQRDLTTDAPTVVFESWAPVDSVAASNANRLRAWLADAVYVSGLGIYAVTEFSGPGFFPDAASQTPVYEWTVQVAMRGVDPVA